MIVLHGAFREDGLWLWGERPRPEVSEPPSRRLKPVRIGRGSRGTASPYDAGEAALTDALSAAGPRTERRPRTGQATGWLPTVDGRPVASSPLIDEPPAGEPTLRPWTLTVCALALPEAIDLLCACIGKAALAPGVFVGKDLAYAA